MVSVADNPEPPRTLIDELLDEQQRLTAVDRFARRHEQHALPAQARYYRDLIPSTKPGAGEQYAFAVDLDRCTGCKACVSACHSLNGLDEDEIWRNTGLLHGGTSEDPYQQTVTTACHHCAEPGCMLGCPVKAYEKDAETGIVRHLDDQCIGCQYCVLKCPYDVPKYSDARGIVRKCDMCQSRLGAGEAPACVQACPSGAISIRTVSTSGLMNLQAGDHMLPGAFDSGYTKPSTIYTSGRPMPLNARPADAFVLKQEHAHWPLIWMLLLTQIACGIFVGAGLLAFGNAAVFGNAQAPLAVAAFVILNAGLGASVLHLGRPLGAWRALLGLRTSWMSREILAFTLFATAGAGFTGAALWPALSRRLPPLGFADNLLNFPPLMQTLAAGTALLGLLGIFCSAMIYIDTHRAFWGRGLTFPKFFGTALLLGSAATAAILGWSGTPASIIHAFAIAALVIRTALFAWESNHLIGSLQNDTSANHRSALVIWRFGRPLAIARAALFVISTVFGVLAIKGTGTSAAVCATLSFFSTFLSQLIERYFFFTAVVALRMPGPPAPNFHP